MEHSRLVKYLVKSGRNLEGARACDRGTKSRGKQAGGSDNTIFELYINYMGFTEAFFSYFCSIY